MGIVLAVRRFKKGRQVVHCVSKSNTDTTVCVRMRAARTSVLTETNIRRGHALEAPIMSTCGVKGCEELQVRRRQPYQHCTGRQQICTPSAAVHWTCARIRAT
jgi:hypothetical protein